MHTDHSIKYCKPMARLILPYFYRGEKLKWALEEAALGHMNLIRLGEEVMAKLGGHSVVSIAGQDLDDGTDVKTCVSKQFTSPGEPDKFQYRITHITNKKGGIRLIAYNKLREEFDFFAIPYSAFRGRNYLRIYLKKKTGQPSGKYLEYRKFSLIELAKAKI